MQPARARHHAPVGRSRPDHRRRRLRARHRVRRADVHPGYGQAPRTRLRLPRLRQGRSVHVAIPAGRHGGAGDLTHAVHMLYTDNKITTTAPMTRTQDHHQRCASGAVRTRRVAEQARRLPGYGITESLRSTRSTSSLRATTTRAPADASPRPSRGSPGSGKRVVEYRLTEDILKVLDTFHEKGGGQAGDRDVRSRGRKGSGKL